MGRGGVKWSGEGWGKALSVIKVIVVGCMV